VPVSASVVLLHAPNLVAIYLVGRVIARLCRDFMDHTLLRAMHKRGQVNEMLIMASIQRGYVSSASKTDLVSGLEHTDTSDQGPDQPDPR
jgi:hypothetical protein